MKTLENIQYSTPAETLGRRLQNPNNFSTEYIRILGQLGRTADPAAARYIAEFFDMPGIVGKKAAQALVKLARSNAGCAQAAIERCDALITKHLDADEIRNARWVLARVERPVEQTLPNAA